MTSTSDSKSRDPPMSSTDKVAPLMVPVTNTSAIATVGSSLTKSIDNQFSSTTEAASIMVLPNSSIVEDRSTSTKFIGPVVSSKVTIPSTILPKSSIVDTLNSLATTSVHPLPSSIVKLITIIDSHSSIF